MSYYDEVSSAANNPAGLEFVPMQDWISVRRDASLANQNQERRLKELESFMPAISAHVPGWWVDDVLSQGDSLIAPGVVSAEDVAHSCRTFLFGPKLGSVVHGMAKPYPFGDHAFDRLGMALAKSANDSESTKENSLALQAVTDDHESDFDLLLKLDDNLYGEGAHLFIRTCISCGSNPSRPIIIPSDRRFTPATSSATEKHVWGSKARGSTCAKI